MRTKLADFARLVLDGPGGDQRHRLHRRRPATRPTAAGCSSRSSRTTSGTSRPTRSSTRLRGKLGRVPGASLFLQAVQDVRIGGRQSNAQYQYTLQSPNLDELNAFAPQMLGRLRRSARAARRGDRPAEPRAAGGGRDRPRHRLASRRARPGHRRRALRRLRSAPGLDHLHRAQPVPGRAGGRPRLPAEPGRARRAIYVRSSTGAQVPLSAFTHFAPRTTPLLVSHQGQFPAVTLSFNLAAGVALGDAVKAIAGRRAPGRLPRDAPREASRARPRPSRRRWPISRSSSWPR